MNSPYYSESDFLQVEKIDAHVHMNTRHSHFIKSALKNNIKLISINTEVPEYPGISVQQKFILDHKEKHPDTVFHLTSFGTNTMFQSRWSEKAVEYIKHSIERGARGVKVWKNIGMDLKRKDGSHIMICDAEFDKIFDYLNSNNIPVLGHIGEPRNCWLPIEKMTVENDKNYYSKHPEFHMYQHPEFHDYDELLESRDKLLKKYPDLLFIGAHLGSMEWSVDEVARRLDRHSNFQVDLTDRICHLQYQSLHERKKVIDFFYAYQDRIIYGTDLEYFDKHGKEEILSKSEQIWKLDWKYFVTDEIIRVPALNTPVKSLQLEKGVVDKIYRINAEKYYHIH